MSQQVQVTVTCPKCGIQYQEKLFRTVWGEHESMRNAVMNDNINYVNVRIVGIHSMRRWL